MEEVLFSLYHLKLINCPQARAASLESPFFFLQLVMKQQFHCPCKILIGRKLEIFYKYPTHSLFIMLISCSLAQKLSQGHLRLYLKMHSSSPHAAMPPAGSDLPPMATLRVNQILSERITRSPENGCVQAWPIRYALDIYNSNLFVFLCLPCTAAQAFLLQGAQ